MRQALWAMLLLCLFPASGLAQSGAVVGAVRDTSGDGVVAALVTLRQQGSADTLGHVSTQTDSLGNFELRRLPRGDYLLQVSRLGFAPLTRPVTVQAGITAHLELVLAAAAVEVAAVQVEVSRERRGFTARAGATTRQLAGADIKRVPGLAEADVFRAVQVLPGIVTTSDFSSAFHVRGGAADENLILLDGFPVFEPYHLGGLFGIFNSDMISGAELLAGGFPAKYGSRVSSVLDVESDAGTSGSGLGGVAGVSLLASRLALGGDLPTALTRSLGLRSARGRISFRRSYFDALLKPFADFPYHLTDMQGYFEGWTPGGGRLTLTAYSGGDVLNFSGEDTTFPLRVKMDWGNSVAGARWTGALGPGRSLDVRAGYTRFGAGIRFPDFSDTHFTTHIGQALLQTDLHVDAHGGRTLDLGVAGSRFDYNNVAESGGTSFGGSAGRGFLGSVYGQTQWRAGAWLTELGMRGDGWYPRSARATWLGSPRLAVKRFLAHGDIAIKIAGGRFTQVVQSTRDEELPIGIDIWQLAGDQAPSVVSDQVQAGIESFRPAGWHLALEAYDRHFRGVIAQNPAADPNDPRAQVLAGRGRSYGADLLVKKERGAVNGWLSASWLHATRTFPDVLSGVVPPPDLTYAPIFDRRLDFELVLRYPLPHGLEGGAHASYGTGLPYTRPVGAYEIFDYNVQSGRRSRPGAPRDSAETAVLLGLRNGARYPSYIRVDASMRKNYRKSWGTLSPYVDVLNLMNRKNVLFYFYEYNKNPPTRSGISMFPILPSIGVEATF